MTAQNAFAENAFPEKNFFRLAGGFETAALSFWSLHLEFG
jgi:hypothetical protein